MRKRLMIVGEAPSPTMTDPDEPMTGQCGKRLAWTLGLTVEDMLTHTTRVNVLLTVPQRSGRGRKFNLHEAREMVALLVKESRDHQLFVLLGTRVCTAFRIKLKPLEFTVVQKGEKRIGFLHLPHPSGVNRWWNSKHNRQRAREVMKLALGLNELCG